MPRGPKTPTINNEPSRTKQEGRRDADVNIIVNTYARTGAWANVNPRVAKYGDFSEAVSLEEAFEMTRNAQAEFMKLPAAVRALANNNPVELLQMLATEEGVNTLEKAGMEIIKPKSAEGPPTETTTPAP